MKTLNNILNLYKKAYSDHPKEVWSMAILTFINRMGTMVLPFLSVYLVDEINFTKTQAGFVISFFGLGMLAGSYIGGKLSDNIDPNKVIIYSIIGSGLSFIALQFFTGFYPLCGMIFLAALVGEAYRPAMMVSLGNVVPKNKMGRTMSLIRLAINLGMAAGPLLGGYVAYLLSYKALFWIDGLTCIAAALFFIREQKKWNIVLLTHKEPDKSDEENEPHLSPFRNKTYMLYLASTFLMAIVFMQWFHSVPVLIKTEWGFDERYIGLLLAVSCLIIVVIEMPLIHYIEEKNKVYKSMILGLILLALAYLCFMLPSAIWVCFFAVTLWTMGETLILPLNTSVAMNISPVKQRGNYMAWYFMCWALSNVFGPVMGLSFIDNFGYDLFWILLAFITMLSLILLTFSKHKINSH